MDSLPIYKVLKLIKTATIWNVYWNHKNARSKNICCTSLSNLECNVKILFHTNTLRSNSRNQHCNVRIHHNKYRHYNHDYYYLTLWVKIGNKPGNVTHQRYTQLTPDRSVWRKRCKLTLPWFLHRKWRHHRRRRRRQRQRQRQRRHTLTNQIHLKGDAHLLACWRRKYRYKTRIQSH